MEKKERGKEEVRNGIKKGVEGEKYRWGKGKKKEFGRHREDAWN